MGCQEAQMVKATAMPAAASCTQGSAANGKHALAQKLPQSKQNRVKRGVRKPKLPSTKAGWAAIHREARRRAAMYYKRREMEGQLVQFNLISRPGGKMGGLIAKMCPPLVNLPSGR
eukprot:jgi/Ulvmu1/2558/UM014_0008.1